MIKKISVFFPTFNEEENVETTVKKAVKVLEDLHLDYEILIINDGSTDNTKKASENLAKKDSKIKIINHPKNLGYGEALKSGFYHSKYDTIVYTDGDGQFDFAEVTKFLDKIEEVDLVIGYRIKRQDPLIRRVFGKGWRLSLLTFFGLTLKDVDCGFKMVKRKVLQTIPYLESQRGAMINAELVIKAKKYGFKVDQVGVNHYPRLSGRPTGASVRVIVRSYADLIRLWWKLKDEKLFLFILLSILFLAAILRFYKIDQYMTFLGDEGRDALIVKEMLVNHHFPLIGPPTSVGNIYLGPLYYYMMASSMAIFWLNPVAAAGMNAFIGILTVALIYYVGKKWFNRTAGLIASYLYAISPVTIIYSKSSWNPNPAPFFSLLSIWGLYKVNTTGNFLWLILTGVMTAAALQMHYLALILIPIYSLIYLYEIYEKKGRLKNLFKGTILGIASFLAVMSPLVWFDFRHNFLNYRAITELFNQGHAVSGNLISNLVKLPNIYSQNLIARYITGENYLLTVIVSLLVLTPFFKKSWSSLALGIWMIVGLLGLSFYQGSVYDHYLGFLNPAPFLLLGAVSLYAKRKWLMGAVVVLLIALSVVNLQKNPNVNSPNNQLKKTIKVSAFIITKTGNKDFNFALIAKNNYDAAYQFYLDMYGYKPKQVPFDITDQLFVVCEDEVCEPINNPKYEIAGFGWVKVDWMQEYYGVKIYRLIPNPSGKP